MKNNTATGLLLGTDAVLGPQVHRGNKFEGTEALAGNNAAQTSKFTVDANENPDFLPNAWLPFDWFLDVADPSLSYQCLPPSACPLPATVTDFALDTKIVKGELTGIEYQSENNWLAQRRFYELVLEEGNPYPTNADVAAFITQAQSSGLAGYAEVQVGIRQLGDMSEEARPSAAASLLSQNNGLTGSAAYQANEKTVNEIFLQTVAIGNYDFTAAQIASLEAIAELCPLSDGEAVLRARAMLNLVHETPAPYDDMALCYIGERSDGKKKQADKEGQFVKLFPNPANDAVLIEYGGIDNPDQRIVLYNILGQVVMEIRLPEEQGRIRISVGSLPGGVYWYSLRESQNLSGKLLINR